jgi:type IV pilus assembly protein PilA
MPVFVSLVAKVLEKGGYRKAMPRFVRRLHCGEMRFARKLHRGLKGFTLLELLVVVALLGILAAVAIPNIAKFQNEGEQEAKDTEHANLQTAVLALLMAAGEKQLDSSYTAIDTEEEVQGVTAGTESLGPYLIGLPYPLHQAYDINQDGEVSVSSGGGGPGGDGPSGGAIPIPGGRLPIRRL